MSDMYFIASDDIEDRHGDIVHQNWVFDSFQKNPVFLWAHNASIPPIGRVDEYEVRTRRAARELVIGVTFAEFEFAQRVKLLFERKFLNAVSIYANVLESEPKSLRDRGRIIKKAELIEVSAVNLAGNERALALRGLECPTRKDQSIIRLVSRREVLRPLREHPPARSNAILRLVG